MHQDPEHSDYDDDEYNYYPQYNEYGYPEQSKKFNIDWAAWEQWLSKAIKEIVEEDNNVWLVGHTQHKNKKYFHAQQSKDKYFMYLGKNNYEEAVWKSKYFINDRIDQCYKNHIANNAVNFLTQPNYYKGMFDILN